MSTLLALCSCSYYSRCKKYYIAMQLTIALPLAILCAGQTTYNIAIREVAAKTGTPSKIIRILLISNVYQIQIDTEKCCSHVEKHHEVDGT